MYLNLHLYLSEHSKASLMNFDNLLSVVVNRSFGLMFIQSFLIVMSFTINKTHQKPPKHVWWLTGYYMLNVGISITSQVNSYHKFKRCCQLYIIYVNLTLRFPYQCRNVFLMCKLSKSRLPQIYCIIY